MLTEASVTAAPESRTSKAEELHTLPDERGAMTISAQLEKREKTARYGPKFAPVTVMPRKRCDNV